MSVKLDAILIVTGTRFRIFPQPGFLKAFSESEPFGLMCRPT
jgi:hypothetical protein